LRRGRPGPFPTPEEAAQYQYTPSEREFVNGWTSSHIVGSPSTVRAGLEELRSRTQADEMMITTMVHGHAQRLRSYDLVADAMGISPRDAVGASDTG
jgi:alkanesulfonate monooxygenase SsuD/methylene tetrahydromethanopterin reductase-like flavin-dependent oxidoreductase (luciferase family)